MIEGTGVFPPFDEAQRPTADKEGRQIAPETFMRWLAPAMWEDTDGIPHMDVGCFHRWMGWEETPESIRETAQIFGMMLEKHGRENPGQAPAAVIVRTAG